MERMRPIQYHLEIYERSFVSDPSYSLTSSTPMPSFTVGDLFDHRGAGNWSDRLGSHQIFRVAEVKHAIWDVESHIGHKLMIRVETIAAQEA